MANLDHIHTAIANLYPGAALGDYIWGRLAGEDGDPSGEPTMLRWDEARFGRFDLTKALAECRRLASLPPPPPEVISDRQFAQALALAGTISEAEALAWAARGELPEAMEDALALIPEADGRRFGARMMLAGATTFERSHPLTGQLGGLLINPATGKPYDAAALDTLWAEAATL
ncbi:hypothetical protein [Methylorubrum extorquens]|uniref:hypothetical protein n=1 Tax=Methylorubrum extorquens TaxID=408 RepID=UPI0022386596|nr:hypothetical protein [Methylorubrum extorquens]UYW34490.1 hypothetical protein OKB92_10530 [Methylorubrum extorquens]